jgi:serine/threonine-protein kinase
LFQGDEVADTLAQVLTKQPDLERVTPKVRRLLGECFEKDPKRRLRDIGDAKRLVVEEHVSVTAPSRSPLAWITAAAFAIALGGLSFVHFRETPPQRPRIRFQMAPSEKFRLSDFKLSPDGRFLAFVTDEGRPGRLWVRALDSLESRVLVEGGALYPFWSPDGEYIAFFAQGQLRKVARSGGPPVALCALPPGRANGGAWRSDGVILFSVTGAVFRVPATSGTPSNVSAPPASSDPELLPGGKFLVTKAEGIWIVSLDRAKPTRILPDVSSSAYVPPLRPGLAGHVLFVRGDTLMAETFDGDKGEPRDEILPVAEQVGNLGGSTRWAFSASENGVLVYGPGNSVDRELVWVDRTGRRLESAAKRFAMPINPMITLSPDDTQIAVSVGAGSGSDFWIADLNRKIFSRFTFDGSRSAIWSPDGKRLLFAKKRRQSLPKGHRIGQRRIPLQKSYLHDLLPL